MKSLTLATGLTAATALLARTGSAEPIRRTKCPTLPFVKDEELIKSIVIDELLECSQSLQDIAYSSARGKSRVVGTDGFDNTVKYLAETLGSLGDYYTLEFQEFTVEATIDSASDLIVNGVDANAGSFLFGNNGTWTDVELGLVANLGCNATDYPDSLAGKVALIARGTCTFASKAAFAGEKGAIGVVIYNNAVYGNAAGTLGGANDLVPVVGITRELGLSYVERINAGETLVSSGDVWSYIDNATCSNVIATSKFGDPGNVLFLGAHADSVERGPGINDNGSGSCALLTIAKQLSNWRTKNQIKFAWWAAEEEGLLGAEHYVETATAADLAKIRLYLNFDMIASPNYVYGIYDGDGSAFGESGPPGSGEAEKLFEDYFASIGIPTVPSEFDGRSDYGPFLDFGVPACGLDTGSDGIKTEEEAALYGGTVGIWYDPNYHSAGDTISNLNLTVYETNSKAIAHAVATYGISWAGFPTRNATTTKRRSAAKSTKSTGHSLPL